MNDLASIVIVTFNQLRTTKRCLRSIRECTRRNYELVIVDNASTDGTPKYLKRGKVHKVIFNSSNVGFAKAVNQGVRLCNGRYIVLLNNDTMVTPGWLEKMIACLESNAKIALAGPLSNDLYKGPQLFRPACLSYVDYDFFRKMHAKNFQSDRTHLLRIGRYQNVSEFKRFVHEFFPQGQPPSYREVKGVTGFCVLMRRAWFNALGGFDERFENGSEDFDLNIRTLLSGKKIAVAENVFVHHDWGRTFWGAGIDRWAHYVKNWKLLEEKWAKVPRAKKILQGYLSEDGSNAA